MAARSIRSAWVVTCVGLAVAAQTGCELLVQLDRSAVDAGTDAGCPICSEPPGQDGGDAGTPDTGTADAGDAATPPDSDGDAGG
jgi:hypothetical protein